MPLHPLLDGGDILLGILELLSHVRPVAVQNPGAGLLVRLGQVDAPAAVLQPGAEVAGQRPGLGGLEVHVVGPRGGVVVEKWVHRRHLTRVGVHPARRLACLDVAPDHWGHVTLVAHEACVEVGRLVRVGGLDVSRAPAEGVFEEIKHGEEVSGRPIVPCSQSLIHHGPLQKESRLTSACGRQTSRQ